MQERWIRRGVWTLLAFVLPAASGCVTPAEVKVAAKAQLELVDALDGAINDLQKAIDAFHTHNAERIYAYGRVQIAQEAVTQMQEGKADAASVRADELFDAYEAKVRPWIELAFRGEKIADDREKLEEKLTKVDQQISEIPDDTPRKQALILEKASLTKRIADMKKLEAALGQRPASVKTLEAAIQQNLTGEETIRTEANRDFATFRKQVALMKVMATKVDVWLSIDVTVSQDQVDALEKNVTAALKAIGEGAQ